MLKNFPNTAEEDIELPNMTRTAGYVNVQQAAEYVSSLSHSTTPTAPQKLPSSLLTRSFIPKHPSLRDLDFAQ